jgi:hypothetical protein
LIYEAQSTSTYQISAQRSASNVQRRINPNLGIVVEFAARTFREDEY